MTEPEAKISSAIILVICTHADSKYDSHISLRLETEVSNDPRPYDGIACFDIPVCRAANYGAASAHFRKLGMLVREIK